MKAKDALNGISFEQVKYDTPGDVKPIITNLVYTYPHWHNELEIVFICKGTVSLSVSGEQYQLSQGDFAIVNSTEIHTVNSATGSESRSIFEKPDGIVFMLQISGRFMRSLHLDIESVRYKRIIEDPAAAEEIRHLLLLIIEEVQSPTQSPMAVIQGFSGAIVATLTKGYCLGDDRESGGIVASRQARLENEHNLERLKRILSWIHEHYNENPSLGEAATKASVSPYYLSHIFTATLGMTFSQYVNSVRIDMARQDLLTTSDRIIDIMLRHGFTNAKTFNRVFKNDLGYSPSEYRKISTLGKTDGDNPAAAPPSRTEMGSYVNYKDKISIPGALYRSHHCTEEGEATAADRDIRVDGRSRGRLDRYPFKMTAVARASDLLQTGIQQQLIAARKEFGFEYLRFHGIFNDEMGLLQPYYEGRYNFRLIDEAFDFLLGIGMRPFVELSFMPSALASGDTTVYYYRGNVTPPRDWEQWRSLVEALVDHLVRRYSREEVRRWYFEVWNEPNYPDFWAGSFEDYLNLYRISAHAVKAVDPAFRVGGPAVCDFYSSDARAYLERFLSACGDEALPLDFVSGHPYPSWVRRGEGGPVEVLQSPDQTRENMEWIRDAVRASPYPDAEIHLDEWNSSTYCRDLIHDTAFMAPFVLHNYLSCQSLAQSLCYWTLSDRFEEIGMAANEFHGGFGLVSMSGLKKPQYHAFAAMRRLGDEILAQGTDHVVTDSSGGEIQALVWNYAHYDSSYAQGDRSTFSYYDRYGAFERGDRRFFRVRLPSPAGADWLVERTVFDRDHGSVFDAWLRNGALEYLTQDQIGLLREQSVPRRELSVRTTGTELVLEAAVEPHGFVLFIARRLNSKNREA